jgi:type I restriction enzyme R subunit
MSPDIFERSFQEAIECGLLRQGPDACAGGPAAVHESPALQGATPPGGYLKRRAEDYDRALCLFPRDVIDFVLAEIERRGALDVLRNVSGIPGASSNYFRPAGGLNKETRRLHGAKLFAAVRQVRYSEKTRTASTWCSS